MRDNWLEGISPDAVEHYEVELRGERMTLREAEERGLAVIRFRNDGAVGYAVVTRHQN